MVGSMNLGRLVVEFVLYLLATIFCVVLVEPRVCHGSRLQCEGEPDS